MEVSECHYIGVGMYFEVWGKGKVSFPQKIDRGPGGFRLQVEDKGAKPPEVPGF